MIMRAERHGIDARGRVTDDPRRGPARSPDALSEPAAGRIGILGGGQLAAMIADAVRRAGLRPLVLAASRSDPAVVAGHEALIGRLDDPDLPRPVLRGGRRRHDRERVPRRARAAHRAGAPSGPELPPRSRGDRPGPGQARPEAPLRAAWRSPTADFEILGTGGLAKEVSRLRRRFPEGFVLKWSRFGYDGRGNFAVRSRRRPSAVRAGALLHGGTGGRRDPLRRAPDRFRGRGRHGLRSRRRRRADLPAAGDRPARSTASVARSSARRSRAGSLRNTSPRRDGGCGPSVRSSSSAAAFAVEFFLDRRGPPPGQRDGAAGPQLRALLAVAGRAEPVRPARPGDPRSSAARSPPPRASCSCGTSSVRGTSSPGRAAPSRSRRRRAARPCSGTARARRRGAARWDT